MQIEPFILPISVKNPDKILIFRPCLTPAPYRQANHSLGVQQREDQPG